MAPYSTHEHIHSKRADAQSLLACCIFSVLQVQFDLHNTFQNPNRLVDRQPFEVTEHGWGEFDIVIHVSVWVLL